MKNTFCLTLFLFFGNITLGAKENLPGKSFRTYKNKYYKVKQLTLTFRN